MGPQSWGNSFDTLFSCWKKFEVEKKILKAEEERRQAAVSINRLKEAAGVESDEVLKKAIKISNELRAHQKDQFHRGFQILYRKFLLL